MPSISYDATLAGLTQPGERDSLLGGVGFSAGDFDSVCAECARLAYVGFDRLTREKKRLDVALAQVGMAASTVIVDKGTDTQAFGSTLRDGRKLVAFRGTQPDRLRDLLTDGKASMVPWVTAGRVHQGFSEAFVSIRPAIEAFLVGGGGLVFTGHSLGAALATLAASAFPGATLVTLGSPRVGDQAFVEGVIASSPVHVRYVDCCDVITTLPPPFPGFYVHCGDQLYIDRGGIVSPGISELDMAVDQFRAQAEYAAQYALKQGDVPTRSFADHTPINYVRAFT